MVVLMSDILLQHNVIILIVAGFLILLMQGLASIFGVYIYKKWDFSSTSASQYALEKKSYLIVLILFFSLVAKIILLPYFAFTLNSLSNVVHGAMCAAGVVGANEYGDFLLGFKIFIIFIVGIWLIVNKLDISDLDYPFIKTKLLFSLVIFSLILVEFIVEILYFTHISTDVPVQCCSVIFGVSGSSDPLPFGINTQTLLILFYTIFALVIIANIQKNRFFSFLASILFLYFGYYVVTYFFGTYVYQLPTHICPFCMLQSEYYFVGYVIWGSLFLGTFFGMVNFILHLFIGQTLKKYFYYSTVFNTVFVIICTAYVVGYYFINGVFL